MANIGPCCYPGCRDTNGDPELTQDVICARSRGRYRMVLDELVEYYIEIRDTMPKPRFTGVRVYSRTAPRRSYFHPAEWASFQLEDIATLFHDWEDVLREHRSDGHATVASLEILRVENGHRYLTNWFSELCTFPVAREAAEEFEDLHVGIKLGLQGRQRREHVYGPCKNCGLPRLYAIDGDGNVECAECNRWMSAADYTAYKFEVLNGKLDKKLPETA